MSDIFPEYKPGRDERNLAMFVHILPLLGLIIPSMHIVIPFVFWLMVRRKSPYLDHHAREALNFQVTITIALIIWIVLKIIIVGILLLPLLPVIALVVLIFMIRSGVMASQGKYYKYPLTIRLIS